jgi:replication fork clamp-binding protein CrfC
MIEKPESPGVASARPKSRPKKQSTRTTLTRLKDLLQNRVTQFEQQIGELGAEISSLANERDIRATNILVRTLEKVLELEHKERKQRSTRARQNRKLNDAEREELARRIANLPAEPHRKNRGLHAGTIPSAGPAADLDELGERETASAEG